MKLGKYMFPWLLLLAMLIITLILLKSKNNLPSSTKTYNSTQKTTKNSPTDPSSSTNRNRNTNRNTGLNRDAETLELSTYSTCISKCIGITVTDIKEVLKKGTINYHHSRLQGTTAPKYVLDGKSDNGYNLRLIITQELRTITIDSIMDLLPKQPCACKGD